MAAVPPNVRSANSRGYRAAVAWNASHIVAGEPASAIVASLSWVGAPGGCSPAAPAAAGHRHPDRVRAIGPGHSGTTRQTGAAQGHGPSFGPGLIPGHPRVQGYSPCP